MLKTPFLGSAYYPEDWPDEELDRDIAKMHDIGLKVARIAEFAWHRMEPEPDQFDFSYFHKVVDKLGAAGIRTILGTPTATPPRWLMKLHPDVAVENENGHRSSHGGRRHCCSNNPDYVRYSLRIVEEMAKSFADDPNVIGWQIDNEIYTWGNGCFCPHCVKKFQRYLKEKYGTIEAVNNVWNLNLFSQWYDSFEDIPAPRDAWHNPHLIMEWRICQQRSNIDFVHAQADILHRYVHVPVGTDTMPFNGTDYRDMTSKLDIVQFNHYNTVDNLFNAAFWFDHLRTLKDRPFWNTETSTCWNGSVAVTREQTLKPDGFCRANSWLSIALGGEANLYWLWRTHWAGHELMHGAVIDTSGRDMVATDEVRTLAKEFDKASDFISGTKVKSDIAIHFSSLAYNMQDAQPVVQDWVYTDTLQQNWYHPLIGMGLHADVIDAAQPLEGYKYIFTPMLMTLEEKDIGKRMAKWVREGGTWIVGPLTDVRNACGARYRDRFYGMLEELTGVQWLYAVPDTRRMVKAHWSNGTAFEGKTWFEVLEDCGSDTLVSIDAGHRSIVGKTLVARKQVGKGEVILLGTVPSENDFRHLMETIGIQPAVKTEGSVLVTEREGEDESGLILIEYENKSAKVTLAQPMINVFTGVRCEGTIELEPYDVKVLKYE